MKTSKFQQDVVGTVVFTKRTMKATKGCGKLYSKYTLFDDIWFSVVKTGEKTVSEVLYHCRAC